MDPAEGRHGKFVGGQIQGKGVPKRRRGYPKGRLLDYVKEDLTVIGAKAKDAQGRVKWQVILHSSF